MARIISPVRHLLLPADRRCISCSPPHLEEAGKVAQLSGTEANQLWERIACLPMARAEPHAANKRFRRRPDGIPKPQALWGVGKAFFRAPFSSALPADQRGTDSGPRRDHSNPGVNQAHEQSPTRAAQDRRAKGYCSGGKTMKPTVRIENWRLISLQGQAGFTVICADIPAPVTKKAWLHLTFLKLMRGYRRQKRGTQSIAWCKSSTHG